METSQWTFQSQQSALIPSFLSYPQSYQEQEQFNDANSATKSITFINKNYRFIAVTNKSSNSIDNSKVLSNSATNNGVSTRCTTLAKKNTQADIYSNLQTNKKKKKKTNINDNSDLSNSTAKTKEYGRYDVYNRWQNNSDKQNSKTNPFSDTFSDNKQKRIIKKDELRRLISHQQNLKLYVLRKRKEALLTEICKGIKHLGSLK